MKSIGIIGMSGASSAVVAIEKDNGTSVRETPEQRATQGVAAVATGSEGASPAENIYRKWTQQRNAAEHGRKQAPRLSPERRAQNERRLLIEEFLYDLRRLTGLPKERQPRPNNGDDTRAAKNH